MVAVVTVMMTATMPMMLILMILSHDGTLVCVCGSKDWLKHVLDHLEAESTVTSFVWALKLGVCACVHACMRV